MKKLIQFTCPKCSQTLAWANETASVYCKHCDRWVRACDIKHINPIKLDPEKDREQLTLF